MHMCSRYGEVGVKLILSRVSFRIWAEGGGGGKTAMYNLVGGIALFTCTVLDNVSYRGGEANAPAPLKETLLSVNIYVLTSKLHL